MCNSESNRPAPVPPTDQDLRDFALKRDENRSRRWLDGVPGLIVAFDPNPPLPNTPSGRADLAKWHEARIKEICEEMIAERRGEKPPDLIAPQINDDGEWISSKGDTLLLLLGWRVQGLREADSLMQEVDGIAAAEDQRLAENDSPPQT